VRGGGPGERGGLRVEAVTGRGEKVGRAADMVLLVVGVRPETSLAAAAGVRLGVRGAIVVDRGMRTGVPGVFAAGDCVVTHHRLLGETYLPLGTTAHKQGRVAGENAVGGGPGCAGGPRTPGVNGFSQGPAPTRVGDHEATPHRDDPVTAQRQ